MASASGKVVCVASTELANSYVGLALRSELGCTVRGLMIVQDHMPQPGLVAFLRVAEFSGKFAMCHVMVLQTPGSARDVRLASALQARCIVDVDKSVQFGHATSASVAARVMHDMAKATTKDQRQAVAERMNERLEAQYARSRETWVLNALAQLECLDTSACLMLQQVASLSTLINANRDQLYENAGISWETACAVEAFFKGAQLG